MASRRRIALIGIAAILFQAILFGWHHHELAMAANGGRIASLSNAAEPLAPAAAEDLCEICIALHHQSATPLAFIAPPGPSAGAVLVDRPNADPIGRADTRSFQARAPPRA
jgi:hypothetical protein